jgi:hypothetical protein
LAFPDNVANACTNIQQVAYEQQQQQQQQQQQGDTILFHSG